MAAALRLPDLDSAALGPPELAAVEVARGAAPPWWERVRDLPLATPAHYGALRFATLYGLREEAVRLPAAVAGVAAVAAALLLGRVLFGAAAALAAGLLIAVAPISVDAARLALPASLTAATALLAAWLLARLLREQPVLWRSAVALAVAFWCGWLALLVAAAAALAALIGRLTGRLSPVASRRVALALVAGLLAVLPWAAFDLPSEGMPALRAAGAAWGDLRALPSLLLFPPGAAVGPAPAVVAALALVGVLARRRIAADTLFAAALAGGAVAAMTLLQRPPGEAIPAQPEALLLQPLYFGLAAAGADALVLRLGLRRGRASLSLLLAAGLAAWIVSLTPPAASGPDWRAAFAVVRANLGRDDRVAAPLSSAATAFYGSDLRRRMPGAFRLPPVVPWLQQADQSWLLGTRLVRFAHWDRLDDLWRQRFVVDLSPGDDPVVLYLGKERRKSYLLACHFELPVEVLARRTLIRDCLREIGAEEGVRRQVRQLTAAAGIPLRNPSLLESASLLAAAGHRPEALRLAEAVAAREPNWPEAQQVAASLRKTAGRSARREQGS